MKNSKNYSDMELENLDQMRYTLVVDETRTEYSYEKLCEALNTQYTRNKLREAKCDTPVKYTFGDTGRHGYISVKKFIVSGQPARYTMIINTQTKESYFVHPDLKAKAIGVERELLDEAGEDPDVMVAKEVLLPVLQVEINTEEYYVW